MLVNECKAKCVKIFYPEAHNEKTLNSVILFSVKKKIMMYLMYHSIHFYTTLKICVTNFISTGNLSTVLHREKFFRQRQPVPSEEPDQ